MDLKRRLEDRRVHRRTMTKDVTRVKVCGDIALVTGRGRNTGCFKGQRIAADEWITDVYRRVDGRWLCVSVSNVAGAADQRVLPLIKSSGTMRAEIARMH